MEQVVQELRKSFKGSIQFYDISFTKHYKIEYCLNGLYFAHLLPYDYIKEKDTREIVVSVKILIATNIHNHFYK